MAFSLPVVAWSYHAKPIRERVFSHRHALPDVRIITAAGFRPAILRRSILEDAMPHESSSPSLPPIEAGIARWELRCAQLRSLASELCLLGKIEQAWRTQDLLLVYETHRQVLARKRDRMLALQGASDEETVGDSAFQP